MTELVEHAWKLAAKTEKTEVGCLSNNVSNSGYCSWWLLESCRIEKDEQ
jgi:hypothetical protein